MISTRTMVISISLVALSIPLSIGQDLSSYRKFQLGMNLPTVAKQVNVKPSEVKVIYQRPAVIQELEWRPQGSYGTSAQQDPVKGILLGFYNGELYRIVVNYDQQRTEGLTNADLIEGISSKYGTPTTPVEMITSSSSSQVYDDRQNVIARWEDAQYSYNLYRSSYGSTPGLLIYSKRLEALAQVAVIEAIRLNNQEAPQRELDRQKKQDDEKLAAGKKVRPANKANFRP